MTPGAAAANGAMIRVIGLNKQYADDEAFAVVDLDLHVDPGSIYCLLGANGAGKSTTINILLDFIEPTSGQALIHGIDVTREPLRAKRYVSYLSENVELYPNFTARQNLDFFASLDPGAALTREDCYRAMARVGLPEASFEQRVGSFSKGMRQKLGIAVCVVRDTPALVLDEPTSGLDPKAVYEVVEILGQLRDEGKAVLMSTHDIFRAKDLADRVGIMRGGRILAEHSRAELLGESLEKLYLEYMRGPEPTARGPGAEPPSRTD